MNRKSNKEPIIMKRIAGNGMSLRGVSAVALLFVGMASHAIVQPDPAATPAPDFDIRQATGVAGKALPAPPATWAKSSAQDFAVEGLRKQVPNLQMRWSALTHGPNRIYSVVQPLTE